jgi:polyhydroxyalkanoate synthase
VAGVTDHITPWKACYRTTQLIGSPNVEFILSQAGHIQSLLNPPGNPKAKYFKSD